MYLFETLQNTHTHLCATEEVLILVLRVFCTNIFRAFRSQHCVKKARSFTLFSIPDGLVVLLIFSKGQTPLKGPLPRLCTSLVYSREVGSFIEIDIRQARICLNETAFLCYNGTVLRSLIE